MDYLKLARMQGIFDSADEGKDLGGSGSDDQSKVDALNKKLSEHDNDSLKLARALMDDNNALRGQLRTANSDLGAAKRLIPSEGSIVITKEKQDSLTSYEALGTLEEIATKLKSAEEATEKLAGFEAEKLVRLAVKGTAYDADKLNEAMGLKGLSLGSSLETVDGAEVTKYHILSGDKDNPKKQTIEDWSKENPLFDISASGEVPPTEVPKLPTSKGSKGAGEVSDTTATNRYAKEPTKI